jgi:hypothetical protein
LLFLTTYTDQLIDRRHRITPEFCVFKALKEQIFSEEKTR